MRRTIALAASAALALTLAPLAAARAQEGAPDELHVDLTGPGDGAVLLGRQSAEVSYRVWISDAVAYTIKSVTVTIAGPDGSAAACQSTYPVDPGQNSVVNVDGSFTWDTTRTVGGAVGCAGDGGALPAGNYGSNGDYSVTVSAVAVRVFDGQEPRSRADDARLTIGHAPIPPQGVTLQHDEPASEMVVSWTPNPEPDLRDYVLEECLAGLGESCSSWEEIARVSPADTVVAVPTAGEGSYSYRVSARRNGAGDVRTSAASLSSPSSFEYDEPAPKPENTGGTGGRPAQTPRAGAGNEDPGTDAPPVVAGRATPTPSLTVRRAAPSIVETPSSEAEEDRGFEESLPYGPGGRRLPDGGEGGSDSRTILIPLAGGALMLVLAGMAWYVNRRAGDGLVPLPVEAFSGSPNGHGNGHVREIPLDDFAADYDEDDYADTRLVGAGARHPR